jgi:hypothetical protein
VPVVATGAVGAVTGVLVTGAGALVVVGVVVKGAEVVVDVVVLVGVAADVVVTGAATSELPRPKPAARRNAVSRTD